MSEEYKKHWNSDSKLFFDEVVSVVKFADKLFFKLNSTGSLFEEISHSLFLPAEISRQNLHEVKIAVIRQFNPFDAGEFGYKNKDQELFDLPKIIPQYWERNKINQKFALALYPEMFLDGDEIHFRHNSREKIQHQIFSGLPG